MQRGGRGLSAAITVRDDTDKLVPATGATAALSLSLKGLDRPTLTLRVTQFVI